jgi:predicted nucleic acid-binding Zn finger protein
MLSRDFLEKKRELVRALRSSAALSVELEKKIEEVYGSRGRRAVEAIKGQRVFKRGNRWFVRGRSGEYEVVKTMCTCRDYVMNIAPGKAGVDMCYHALAKTVCELLGTHYVDEPVKRS